jgi:hypothetical protein
MLLRGAKAPLSVYLTVHLLSGDGCHLFSVLKRRLCAHVANSGFLFGNLVQRHQITRQSRSSSLPSAPPREVTRHTSYRSD